MTYAAWEWFMGRYEDELGGPHDLRETYPIWKSWWFRSGIVAAIACLAWLILSVAW